MTLWVFYAEIMYQRRSYNDSGFKYHRIHPLIMKEEKNDLSHIESEAREGGTIITIERNEKRIKKAKENIKNQGKEEQITLLEGDAIEILKGLDGSFDLIFVDAAKGQYIHFLDDVLRLLAPEGVLVSDNVLQDGDVARSRYAIERRDRTIHKRMRDYLYTIKNHPQLETTILPVGDGVAISIKMGESNERR